MPLFATEVVDDSILKFLRGKYVPSTGGNVPNATTTVFGIVIYANNGASVALRAVQANDSRLSDARSPIAHSSRHAAGGIDALKLDDLDTPDDNTDLDATTGRHGLMSKADKTKLDGLPTTISGGNIHIVSSGAPGVGVGVNGDVALVLASQETYYKTGGAWALFGQQAKAVSNSQATFTTPSAGDGTTELATP